MNALFFLQISLWQYGYYGRVFELFAQDKSPEFGVLPAITFHFEGSALFKKVDQICTKRKL
jgi:hypothetical protein